MIAVKTMDEYEKKVFIRGLCIFLALGFLLLFIGISVIPRVSGSAQDKTGGDIKVEEPVFSKKPGFYENAFFLKIRSKGEGIVYYTTDGSIPNKDSIQYTEPIYIYDRSEEPNVFRSIANTSYDWFVDPIKTEPVDKGIVIRAATYSEIDDNWSDPVTATYFVGLSERGDSNTVVSLIADPEDLFGNDGIYVTGSRYDEWYVGERDSEAPVANFDIHGLECPAVLQIFDSGKVFLDQDAGMRIRAHSGRDGKIKQFSVYSRQKYGTEKVFEKKLFKNKSTHSFALRQGFENAVMMYFGKDRDVTYLQSFPVDVFLNGEYWYSAYLQEKYNETFFEETYGINDVEIFKDVFPQEVLDMVQNNDMSVNENYEKFCELVDIQSYMDFSCINVYIANCDYYIEGSDNTVCWRSKTVDDRPYNDRKLRWCLYDLDLCSALCRGELELDYEINAQIDSFNVMRDWAPSASDSPIFSSLKRNPEFCTAYVNTFMDLINTTFREENASALLQEWGSDISFDENFFIERKRYITKYLAEEFGLTGDLVDVVIGTNKEKWGSVRINTITPELSLGEWTGEYFTEHPIKLSAVAKDGHKFIRWSGDIYSEEPDIEVIPKEDGIHIYAIFE